MGGHMSLFSHGRCKWRSLDGVLGESFLRGNIWLFLFLCLSLLPACHAWHKTSLALTSWFLLCAQILSGCEKLSLLKQYLFLAICQVLLILGRNAFMDDTDLTWILFSFPYGSKGHTQGSAELEKDKKLLNKKHYGFVLSPTEPNCEHPTH